MKELQLHRATVAKSREKAESRRGRNTIGASGGHSAIAGGAKNTVSAAYGFVGGGLCNALSGTYGVISGGCCNTVSGNYSAVLGGKGNTVTHNFAAVFGNGLVSCSNDTFHISCLNAVNTPAGPSIFPNGTVFYQTGILPFPYNMCKFLFLY
jgi:hypothetical protein